MGVYSADFETRAGKQAEIENLTYVWAWSIVNILDIENVWTGNTIKDFFKFIRKLGDSTIYFHNLKFDGRFILDYLLKNGYTYAEDRKAFNNDNMAFMTLLDDKGVFYSITIHNGYRKKIVFQDSLKKAPFSVAKLSKDFNTKYKKLNIDYVAERPEIYDMSEQEKEYVKNDVRVIAEVLRSFYAQGYDKMTIGSDSLSLYKKIMGSKFNNFFPVLEQNQDSFIRKAYKGGWCYCNNAYSNRVLTEKGNTYDVNSLYPSMMSSTPYEMFGEMVINKYPIYNGVYYEGKFEADGVADLYIQHIRAHFILKDGYLPTIQLKNNFRFAQNEYIVDSEGVEDLYLTCVDLELFLMHYDVFYLEYVDGYKFVSAIGLFDDYIFPLMEIKANSTGAVRAIAKLQLNNLYGKFGQSIDTRSKVPYLDEEKQIVRYRFTEWGERKPVYVPVAAFITSYARRFTIYHAQQNYKNFCYADTDSIHCIGEAKNLLIHPSNLCAWKHESSWDEAKFLRQKTYMEHITHEDEKEVSPYYSIKCAGMPENVKEAFLHDIETGKYTIDDFKVGLTYENLKLKPKTVRGGVILCTTPYTIHE